MSAHTPGPWVVNKDSSDCGDDKLSVETLDEYFICQVDGGVSQEANARLVASAPDLLEALQALVDLDQRCGWHSSALDAALAAIAKATGAEP